MNQHCTKYFACRPPPPPPTLASGLKGQKSTFSEHGHVTYQIKRDHEIYPLNRPWGWGQKVKFNFFSHGHDGHVAYQIKENHECSNMEPNILPADPPPPPPIFGLGSIGQNST